MWWTTARGDSETWTFGFTHWFLYWFNTSNQSSHPTLRKKAYSFLKIIIYSFKTVTKHHYEHPNPVKLFYYQWLCSLLFSDFFIISTNSEILSFWVLLQPLNSPFHALSSVSVLEGNCLSAVAETQSFAFRLCSICQKCLNCFDGVLHYSKLPSVVLFTDWQRACG